MKRYDASEHKVKIARISALQAVGVALIGVIGGIASTLVSQNLARPSDQSAATGSQHTESAFGKGQPQVADPSNPQISFHWFPIEDGLESCKERAGTTLTNYGAAEVDSKPSHTVFARSGPYAVMIACLTDFNVAIVGAVGPNADAASTIRAEIRERFGRLRR